MGYESLSIGNSLTLIDPSFGTTFALSNLVRTKRRQKKMEFIFAICITGLGLFMSIIFIWKGYHP